MEDHLKWSASHPFTFENLFKQGRKAIPSVFEFHSESFQIAFCLETRLIVVNEALSFVKLFPFNRF